MKIALAQLFSKLGDIEVNTARHIYTAGLAAREGAQAIYFPELSLTGYHTLLAKASTFRIRDTRLQIFRELASDKNIIIGIGLPIASQTKPLIAMMMFYPNAKSELHFKHRLHHDEQPYFSAGSPAQKHTLANQSIAFGICYESLHPDHIRHIRSLKPDLYLATVAKNQKGVGATMTKFGALSEDFSCPVLMVNAVGQTEDFIACGQTSVWMKSRIPTVSLSADKEELLVIDTASEEYNIFTL